MISLLRSPGRPIRSVAEAHRASEAICDMLPSRYGRCTWLSELQVGKTSPTLAVTVNKYRGTSVGMAQSGSLRL